MGVVRAVLLCSVLPLVGCGLVTQSGDGASVGAPTPVTEPRAIPIRETTTTTLPDQEFEIGVDLAEMNINDDYELGRPGAEQCDAAFVLVATGVEQVQLGEDDPVSTYVESIEDSITAGRHIVAVAESEVLSFQAAGGLVFYQELLDLANSGATVPEIRAAMNAWASRDGVNAGTWLLAVQQECPDIVSGVQIPSTVFDEDGDPIAAEERG